MHGEEGLGVFPVNELISELVATRSRFARCDGIPTITLDVECIKTNKDTSAARTLEAFPLKESLVAHLSPCRGSVYPMCSFPNLNRKYILRQYPAHVPNLALKDYR
jgi:hypothetical protein